MNIKNDDNRGFSLVEALVYMTLTFFILITLTGLVVDVTKTSARLIQAKEVHHDLRLLVNQISQEIKTAREVIAVTPTRLTLQNKNGVNVFYEYDSTHKTIRFDDGVNNINMGNQAILVNDCVFGQMDHSVKINLSLAAQHKLSGQNSTYAVDFESYVFLRQQLY